LESKDSTSRDAGLSAALKALYSSNLLLSKCHRSLSPAFASFTVPFPIPLYQQDSHHYFGSCRSLLFPLNRRSLGLYPEQWAFCKKSV